MDDTRREVIERKLLSLLQFITDLQRYGELDTAGRRREHYAIERLLQLLCEVAADIGLQLLKVKGYRLASSYREVFEALRIEAQLPEGLAEQLMDACAMRNLLTHLYDVIDIDRVAVVVDPASRLYQEYHDWVEQMLNAHFGRE